MSSRETANQSDLRGYCQVKPGAVYAGVSARTFRDWLKLGLAHFRLSTGTILVSYADIDTWLSQFRADGSKLDEITEEVLKGF